MAAIGSEIKQEVFELSSDSFDAFCSDIGSMFGVAMTCKEQQSSILDIKSLSKQFKKTSVVFTVSATGALKGDFYISMDQAGLFILGGTAVMMPENRIKQMINKPADDDLETVRDAVGEMGNLCVGSWDKIFRENLQNHGHFLQTGTFIGLPWKKPEEMKFDPDQQFESISYKMAVDSHPEFECVVLYPVEIFGGGNETQTKEPEQQAEPVAEIKEEPEPQPAKAEPVEKPKPVEKAKIQPEPEPVVEKQEAKAEEAPKPEPVVEKTESEKPVEVKQPEPVAEKAQSAKPAALKKAAKAGPSKKLISETIRKLVSSPANLPGEDADGLLNFVTAGEIMQKTVIWCREEDTVETAQAKIESSGAEYVLIGEDGLVRGMVSKSDLNSAVSIYLKPMFSQWQRPLDDATLRIKLKWIMSSPVCTVPEDSTLNSLIKTICHEKWRCIPVVDDRGIVRGIVTIYDILLALHCRTA